VSDTLAKKRRTYVRALGLALETAIRELPRLPEVEKVVLFGSYRRGRRDLFTDLDLLVVMRYSDEFLARMGHLYELLAGKMGVDYDLVAYTPEEIAAYGETPFLRRALAEGKVVYEKGR
jgi:predicted nucleotidyltransferase